MTERASQPPTIRGFGLGEVVADDSLWHLGDSGHIAVDRNLYLEI